MTTRTEKVYVLYGSQTGNSEQAAKDLCSQVESKLGPSEIQKMTGTKDVITVVPTHMQLDDFLELERCKWTRLMVIITSSYGVGQAPLGCYRFRDLSDAWMDEYNVQKHEKVLKGLYFAMCGLGDSKYPTFFQNPKTINDALNLVGAERVGPLGKADASGTGNDIQQKVIERWMDGIWPHLAKVVVKEPLPPERLEEMQRSTVKLCQKINPDFMPEEKPKFSLAIPILVLLLAVAAYYVATMLM